MSHAVGLLLLHHCHDALSPVRDDLIELLQCRRGRQRAVPVLRLDMRLCLLNSLVRLVSALLDCRSFRHFFY